MIRFLCLLALAVPLVAQVKVTPHGAKTIAVEIDGKPFTDFYIGNEGGALKPYLHPLRSATGKVVTRGFPMLPDVPGESHDHPHQRGLWFTHGDVNGLDFWGAEVQKDAAKRGVVALAKVDKAAGGKRSGEIAATFNWNAPDGKTLLTETRRMIFYSDPVNRVIDFDITLHPDAKVTFGDTKEGTFAIRLAAGLEEPQKNSPPEPKRTGAMVNAVGKSGEKAVWGKRSEWVDYAGELEGERLGIAILDHPANPRHPTYWHSRSYGLFAANIFGVRDFENDTSKDGSLTIGPGQPLRFRYRVIIHPGNYQSAGIGDQYQKYAAAR
jgi:methane monooxygenase PmoA-like